MRSGTDSWISRDPPLAATDGPVATGGRAPTPDAILDTATAYRRAKVLLGAIELDVFTVAGGGPVSGPELTTRLAIDRRGGIDFLDSLVALGLLVRDESGCYVNSAESSLYLDRTKPTCIVALLEQYDAREYAMWGALTDTLRTGRPQTHIDAEGHFGPLYADPARLKMFLGAMTAGSRPPARVLASSFPWPCYRTLIDIGTSQGCLPVEIAKLHPHLTGGGFDLPELGPSFESYVAGQGLSHRLRFFGGDFFADELPVADILVMGRVLHNWDLPKKRMLLGKAYQALQPGGSLIVYDALIDRERRGEAFGLLNSLNMMLWTEGGFGYTAAECRAWMEGAGFKNVRVEPLTAMQSAIVGEKV